MNIFQKFLENYNKTERVPLVIIDERLYDYKGMFHIDKTQDMVASDILQNEDYGYFYFYKGVNCKIKMMTPLDYLEICKSKMGYDSISTNIIDSSLVKIKDAVDKGIKIDMPYYTEGRFSQEGRNRAYFAHTIGEKLIPVCVIYEVTYQDKINKAKEICNSLNITIDSSYDDIASKLFASKYHRDVIRFIDMNREDIF